MKKLLIILIAFMFVQVSAQAIEQTSSDNSGAEIKTEVKETFDKVVADKAFKISNVDKKGRGESELNIFTPKYGETTKTDKKGIEAVVINNKIVKTKSIRGFKD